MKSLLFVISVLAFIADARAQISDGSSSSSSSSDSVAPFDPVDWCQRRDFSRNFIQYVANPDNRTEFFQCEKTKSGIVAHKQSCQRCFEFSNDVLQCLKVPAGCDAPTEAPITEFIYLGARYCYLVGNGAAGLYTLQYRPGSLRYTYYWSIDDTTEVEMSCPPGTFFSARVCKCVWCDGDGPCAGSSNRVFTLNFDSVSSQNGIYFDLAPSIKLVRSGLDSSLAAEFDGISSNIEVPYFQNNEFSQFTFVGSFKRYAGGDGAQGILYNGGFSSVDEFDPPSIYVISQNPSQVVAGIITENGQFEVVSSAEVSADEWVSVILRYNGVKLELWVNDIYDFVEASGMTLRFKDVLKFGQSYDIITRLPQYFKGALDSLSWYRTAINVPISDNDLPSH